MLIDNSQLSDGGLVIKITFSPHDIRCLKHSLNGIEGIVSWYSSGPSAEKIENSCSQMIEENKNLALNTSSQKDVLNFISLLKSNNKEGIVSFISSMPLYQDRATREAEALKLQALKNGLISQ